MHDPWTGTIVGRLPDGVGDTGWGREKGKNQESYNGIINQI